MTSKGKHKARVTNRKRRPLLIAGAVIFLIGASILAGVYLYLRSTNRTMSSAQSDLMKYWVRALNDRNGEPPDLYGGVAHLTIPKIDVDYIVVDLDGMDDQDNLKRGPGHVPGTAYPGVTGNVVIAGHRTTYGAPFRNIDKLEAGDKIIIETLDGKFVYEVTEQLKVDPSDISVLNQEGKPRVTLSACDPPYGASKRLIVIGDLVLDQ
ncbi:MAG: class E sortase [Actinobacteria bacterium]|nr:class E sortase [Actinomycetota bacterium]